jgi:pimeloyl-ACP methyl ester carboxylesterase
MGINNMILCAHSFGAYIATSYTHKYPNSVIGLILYEPWGFELPPNYTSPISNNWYNFLISIINPLSILKIAGPVSIPIKKILTKDLFNITFRNIGKDDEIFQYLYHSNVQCTGDVGFMNLLGPYYIAHRPMGILGIKSNLHITLIYGSNSWIDSKSGDYIYTQRGINSPTFVDIIPNAGHQVYADQCELFIISVLRAIKRIYADINYKSM